MGDTSQIRPTNLLVSGTPYVDIRAMSPTVDISDGSVSAVAALAAAAAIGSPVLIPPGTYLIDASYSCTASLIMSGGKFSVTSGATLTINGALSAGLSQIFAGDGATEFAKGAVHEVYPQWWGAKADGSTDDSAAIAGALAAVVDGGTIKAPAGTYVVAMNAMSFGGKSVSLIGDNATLSLVAGTGTSVFDTTDSDTVLVKGIKFTTAAALAAVFADCLTGYTETFVVTDCEFIGPVRLIYNTGSTTQDPTVTPFGFGTFRYEHNKSLNVNVSHIKIIDTPISKGIVRNNDIRNFSYVYLSNGTTNASDNNDAMMSQGHFVISDNVVVNDDDHYCADGTGTYYAFALIENNTVIYERNHVEGMKINASGWTCYDAYLSSINVLNRNNVFKNSANFYAGAANNTLIKCKRDSSESLPTTKQIIGNSYVMESDWVARIGKTPSEVRHNLMGIGVVNGGKVVIADNTFDLMMLDLSGTQYAEDFTFANNVIIARGISPNAGSSGRIVEVRPFSATSVCSVLGNKVTVSGASLYDFYFISQSGGTTAWNNLAVMGNTIDVDIDPSKNFSVLITCCASNATICDNVSRGQHRYTFNNCVFKNVWASNNVFIGQNTSKLRPAYYIYAYGNSSLSLRHSGLLEGCAYRVLKSATYTPAASTKYIVAIEYNTATGKNRIEFKYELQYAAGVYTVVWTDSVDNVRSDVVGTTDGAGILVKTTASGDGALTLTVKFQNSSTDTFFQGYGFPTTACDYSYEIRSFEA